MKPIYNLEDIHDLLSKKYERYDWDYEIYDRMGKKRKATIEDFTDNITNIVTLAIMYKNDEYDLDVQVTNFSFVVYQDEPNIMGSGATTSVKNNFTSDWIKFLLDKYEGRYAKKLLQYSEKCKNRIKEDAEYDIAIYTNKVNDKAKRESAPYENLSRMAKQFLPLTDIVDIEQEIKK